MFNAYEEPQKSCRLFQSSCTHTCLILTETADALHSTDVSTLRFPSRYGPILPILSPLSLSMSEEGQEARVGESLSFPFYATVSAETNAGISPCKNRQDGFLHCSDFLKHHRLPCASKEVLAQTTSRASPGCWRPAGSVPNTDGLSSQTSFGPAEPQAGRGGHSPRGGAAGWNWQARKPRASPPLAFILHCAWDFTNKTKFEGKIITNLETGTGDH